LVRRTVINGVSIVDIVKDLILTIIDILGLRGREGRSGLDFVLESSINIVLVNNRSVSEDNTSDALRSVFS
jgi:hypothetical protein